ncbi:hypothetical protein DPMN_038127 [Dreissena polymorpha]|uniref:Uncharacterized protein n=1 Tax=Dreissena polymorpha TaxID=45954 RepID=A0A9D4MGC9_DREPO|nr:hypothetical protein DPMN_038127 [Dreissena polymorpha]
MIAKAIAAIAKLSRLLTSSLISFATKLSPSSFPFYSTAVRPGPLTRTQNAGYGHFNIKTNAYVRNLTTTLA